MVTGELVFSADRSLPDDGAEDGAGLTATLATWTAASP
jgi:hypothetical protein